MPEPLGSVINWTVLATLFTHSFGIALEPETTPTATSLSPFTVKLLSNKSPLVVSNNNFPGEYSSLSGILEPLKLPPNVIFPLLSTKIAESVEVNDCIVGEPCDGE